MRISLQERIEVAKAHHVNVVEDTVEVHTSGLDFLVISATDVKGREWILRFPKRNDVLNKAKEEHKILTFLQKHVSFQVPNWTIYTKQLIAYQKLDGFPAASTNPEQKDYIWKVDKNHIPEIFHQTLAESLVSLHRIPMESITKAGFRMQTIDQVRTAWAERMNKTKQKFKMDESLWARWQGWLQNDKLWPRKTGFIHGDLHAGHIMIDQNAKVTGLIDWTEAAVSDISMDFIFYYLVFGKSGCNKLIHWYEKQGGEVWPLMLDHIKELTSTIPIHLSEFADRSGLEEYNQIAQQALSTKPSE